MGGSAVGVGMVEGFTDRIVVESSGGSSVEGCVGVSVELAMIVLLLVAMEVGCGMPVASTSQLMLVGPACERNPLHHLVFNYHILVVMVNDNKRMNVSAQLQCTANSKHKVPSP